MDSRKRTGWLFHTAFEEVLVVPRWALEAGDKQDTLPRIFGRAAVEGWLADPTRRQVALEMHGALTGGTVYRVAAEHDDRIAARIEQAFDHGELIALKVKEPVIAGGAIPDKPPAPPGPPPAPPVKKVWIEIEVVDDRSSPLPGVKYKIELPDASTREGRTDKKGKARLEGIDPGSCKISFPELDKDAWAAA